MPPKSTLSDQQRSQIELNKAKAVAKAAKAKAKAKATTSGLFEDDSLDAALEEALLEAESDQRALESDGAGVMS